jgi:hypothetical protein
MVGLVEVQRILRILLLEVVHLGKVLLEVVMLLTVQYAPQVVVPVVLVWRTVMVAKDMKLELEIKEVLEDRSILMGITTIGQAVEVVAIHQQYFPVLHMEVLVELAAVEVVHAFRLLAQVEQVEGQLETLVLQGLSLQLITLLMVAQVALTQVAVEVVPLDGVMSVTAMVATVVQVSLSSDILYKL